MRSYYCSIHQLPGIDLKDVESLNRIGIHTTKDLLQKSRSPEQQAHVSSSLRLHSQHLKKWVALADLARVPSVNHEYCGLLLHAGIATPRMLSIASLPRLHHQIRRLHVAQFQDQTLCPSLPIVRQWIQHARQMDR